jgi:DNA-binding transcriptional regulator YiaG
MTKEQFKKLRKELLYSQQALADEWSMGVHGGRSIRRWETGERPLNPIAAYCLHLMHSQYNKVMPTTREQLKIALGEACKAWED